MDIKTRLTRCCGKPMGGLYQCHEGLRCSDCFDKLEGWREIERLREALRAINRKNDNPAWFNPDIHEIVETALQQKDN